VCQVTFEEPIVMASVSPKHDTYPLIRDSGRFSVSILAGDQVAAGQYFSYPGRKFRHLADELIELTPSGLPVVVDSIAWLACDVFEIKDAWADGTRPDHHLFFARVVEVGPGRLKEPPLLYSSRLGWRIAGDKAREPGTSIRDQLLERLAASGLAIDDDGDDEEA
jgi:flavin reductase (DIM6/NTAB) family NADH-FMN oxidoreductase RutF